MSNNEKVATFGYWPLRGFGQSIRFLVAYLDLNVEEIRYPNKESWFDKEKASLGLEFPNLPYWIEKDLKITESVAILRHVCRKYGSDLIAMNEKDTARAEMLQYFIQDFWMALLRMCFFYTDDLRELFAKNMPAKFENLCKFVGNNTFLMGDKLSYVDFLAYEALFHFKTYDPDWFKPYPILAKYMDNFEKIPNIATYLASPAYIAGPCINPYAKRRI